MIQKETNLVVADNSGARSVRVRAVVLVTSSYVPSKTLSQTVKLKKAMS